MKKNLAWVSFFFLLVSPSAHAIGPRNVTSGGSAVKWASMPVVVSLESDLDVRGKDVSGLVSEALNTWVDLTESDVTVTQASLGAAVDNTNVCTYVYDTGGCPNGPTSDGINPLIIDEDGEVTATFFGVGNKFTTLGFASIISFTSSTGAAGKGEAVFNASCLAGVMASGCTAAIGSSFTGFSDDDFTSFIVHETGHFLGLDHSQVNLTEATDSDSSNDSLITTMFPTFIIGNGANFKTPERDDQVGLAQLYPASSFSSSTGTISGTVSSSASTQIQCANVVARNQASSRADAISALSGDFAASGTASGSYTLPGLTSGAAYTITVEPIAAGYTGASGYTPCRGSNGESSPPQFTSLTSTSLYTASAGQTTTVDCTIGGDCTSSGTSTTTTASSGGSGGCSLMAF